MNSSQRNLLIRMRNSAQRMRSMVNGLLQLSRLEMQAQPIQRINLNQILQEVVADLDLPIRQSSEVIDVCEFPEIEADPLQMHRLFQNLISNALKFQPPGNQPRVKVCPQQAEPGFVQILVADNGIGFDEAHASHLFEPFKRLVGRTQFEGSGIGLAICRKIVERHQGMITAHSQPGQGTLFLITLPIYHDPIIPTTGGILRHGGKTNVIDRRR